MRKDPLIIDKVKARYKYTFYKKYIYEEFVNSFEIKGDESILDFGCKFGYISYICSKKLDTGKISCIDFTSKWLLEAKKRLKNFDNIDFALYNQSFKFNYNQFDLIICNYCLKDFADNQLSQILKNFAISLKLNGRIIIRESSADLDKIRRLKQTAKSFDLVLKNNLIKDVPFLGNSIEIKYIKNGVS